MTTKHEVIEAHRLNPLYTAAMLARHLDCMPEYVSATARRNGLKLPNGVHSRDADSLRAQAAALIQRAERLEAEGRQ